MGSLPWGRFSGPKAGLYSRGKPKQDIPMGKIERTLETPRYIKLNARDNVAIVVNDFGLPAGSTFACGLTLRAFVPQGHKVALSDIAEGEPIIRYGEVIGHAATPIKAGDWV